MQHLNLADLSRLIGNEVVGALANMNLPATKHSLIEMIIDTKGINVFFSKSSREIILQNENCLSELQLEAQEATRLINSNFRNTAHKFAALLDIPSSEVELFEQNRSEKEIVKGDYSLMPYQNWMRRKVFDYFNSNEAKRALLHMPTGAGKTSTAMQIIFDQIRLRSPKDTTIIWMAHSDELCEQAIESFETMWPSQQISHAVAWRAWGGFSQLNSFDGKGCNFVVTSFQTLYSWQKSGQDAIFRTINSLKRSANFLVVDEAHMSTAKTYASVIDYISGVNTSILGLTATPGRHGVGEDIVETEDLAEFFEHKLIHMTDDDGIELDDPISFLQSKKILSKIVYGDPLPGADLRLSEQEQNACAKIFEIPESILKKIGDDSQRTLNVARAVLDLALNQGKQTLVFCPSMANAKVLSEYLKINKCKVAAITGDLPKGERRQKLASFKNKNKHLTNFGVLTTGLMLRKLMQL